MGRIFTGCFQNMVNVKGYESVFIVLKPRWATIVFLLCIVSSSFARHKEDVPVGEPLPRYGPDYSQQLRTSCMMLNYVRSKGCDYVMAFVKGHYYAHNHDHDDARRDISTRTCDWKPRVERKCMEYHIPTELCCALMDCGFSRSMTALGVHTTGLGKCNMTYALGRRTSKLCDAVPSVNFMCNSVTVFGKRSNILGPARNVINITELTQNISHTNQLNTSFMIDSITMPISSLNVTQAKLQDPSTQTSSKQRPMVQKWCKLFSRKVNKLYHLNEVKFIRNSVYWLVDVYKAAGRQRVPKRYTHGLVGCGMEYAMLAFNVKKWQTVLYNHALK